MNLRTFLALILSFQISLGQFFCEMAYADVPKVHRTSVDLREVISQLPQAAQKELIRYVDALEDVSTGKIPQEAFQIRNTARIAHQFIEIKGRGVFSLDNPQINLPPVSFTKLRVKYDQKTSTLVIEGTRGENDKGENGEVVARHFIPNMDVASLVQDNELTALVSSSGVLSAIPMDYVISNAFKSPLIIAEKIWEPLHTSVQGKELKVRFINPGENLKLVQNAPVGAVIPTREDGQIEFDAGSILLTQNNNSGEELVGIFTRRSTFDRILITLKFLMGMSMQIYPDKIDAKLADAMLKDMDVVDAKVAFETSDEVVPEIMRKAMFNVDPSQILSSTKHNTGRRDSIRHTMTIPKWAIELNAIREQARKEEIILKERLRQAGGPDNSNNRELQERLQGIQAMLADDTYSQDWRSLLLSSQVTPDPRNRVRKSEAQLKVEKLKDFSFKYLAPVLATGALFGFPYAYEASTTAQQIQVLSWLYEIFPAVMKDVEYRNTLVKSVFSIIALWPVAVSTSWAVGKVIALMGKTVQSSNSRFAGIIRDFAKQWAPLTAWQRSGTAGLRMMGVANYPPIRFLISHLFRQPNIVTAWNNGVNPFQKVKTTNDSNEEIRAGIINPFLTGENKQAALERSNRALSILSERKRRVDALAWKLAVIVVSQSEKVDPAAIEMVVKGQIPDADLEKAFTSKENQKDWRIIHSENIQMLKAMGDGIFKDDLATISSESMDTLVAEARTAAQKLKSLSKNEKYLRLLKIQGRKMMAVPQNFFLNLGVADSQFMRTVFMNKVNADQTERGFVPDHFMIAVYYALWGGRADLNDPKNLSADTDGILWTAGQHWSDVAMQVLIHFFIASSRRVLLFQSVMPEVENAYDPIEFEWVNSVEKTESFLSSLSKWFKSTDPRVSNIGEAAWKSLKKRVNTLWPGLYLAVATRMIFAGKDFSDAFWGYGLFFNLSFIMFAWPWLFIDGGANYEESRIAEMKAEYSEALRLLNLGQSDPNEQKAQAYRNEGAQKMMDIVTKYNPDFTSILDKLSRKGGVEELGESFAQLDRSLQSSALLPAMKLAAALRLKTTKSPEKENRILGIVSQSEKESIINAAKLELKSKLKNGVDTQGQANIDSLTASELIKVSLEELPIHTKAHPLVNWMTTFWFGAVGTTALSVPLAILSFDGQFFGLGWFLAFAALNVGTHLTFRAAFKKDGWIATLLNKRDAAKKAKAEAQSGANDCVTQMSKNKDQSGTPKK